MKKTILVATSELTGGTEKGGRAVVKAHEELTRDARSKLGLDDDAVAGLLASGALIEVPANVASSSDDNAALRTAEDRATAAEAEVTQLKTKVDDLQKQLDAARATARTDVKTTEAPKA